MIVVMLDFNLNCSYCVYSLMCPVGYSRNCAACLTLSEPISTQTEEFKTQLKKVQKLEDGLVEQKKVINEEKLKLKKLITRSKM